MLVVPAWTCFYLWQSANRAVTFFFHFFFVVLLLTPRRGCSGLNNYHFMRVMWYATLSSTKEWCNFYNRLIANIQASKLLSNVAASPSSRWSFNREVRILYICFFFSSQSPLRTESFPANPLSIQLVYSFSTCDKKNT